MLSAQQKMLGHYKSRFMRKQLGMTLMELLIVVAIMGILATVGVPILTGNIRTAKNAEAQNTLKSIFLMQKNYYGDNYCYYVTPAQTDNTQQVNQFLMNSAQPSKGPIVVGTDNDFYFYITAGTAGQGGSCTGSNAYDYVAYARSRTTGVIYSINQQNIKSGF